jgi:hypothetical protein
MPPDVSAASGSIVDPLKLKPVRLSVGTIQHLVEKRYFPVHLSSPLVPLTKLAVSPEQKNGKELVSIGLPAEPQPDVRLSAKGRAYLEALMIAATPEARLEYSELNATGAGSMTMDLVLGLGQAVIVDIDTEGLSLSPAVLFNDLLKPMARHLQNAELGFPNLNVWQSQLRTLGWVFTNLTELPQSVFEERVATGGHVNAKDAAKVTQEFLKAGLLLQKGELLILNPQLSAFVERTATGLIVELLLTPYGVKGKPGERRELRFFGKPDDRIGVLTLKGQMLKDAMGGPQAEGALISIMSMGRDPLLSLLESFIGMPQPT